MEILGLKLRDRTITDKEIDLLLSQTDENGYDMLSHLMSDIGEYHFARIYDLDNITLADCEKDPAIDVWEYNGVAHLKDKKYYRINFPGNSHITKNGKKYYERDPQQFGPFEVGTHPDFNTYFRSSLFEIKENTK